MNPDGSIQYDFIADRSPAVVKPYLIPALEKCKDIAGRSLYADNKELCMFSLLKKYKKYLKYVFVSWL